MLTAREQDAKVHAVGGSATGAAAIDAHLRESTVPEKDGALVGGAELAAAAKHFVAAGSAVAAAVLVAAAVAAVGSVDA